jgi:GT2 family glycosyltransferase
MLLCQRHIIGMNTMYQAAPSVHIIVLNYNSREDTLACLRSLEHLTYPNYRVLLVDNASSDGTEQAVRSRYPDVTVIQNGRNLGFAGGNNAAIQLSLKLGADYILLLNNDTIVAPDFLDVMIEVMEQNPKVGVAGPMIYYHSQPEKIWSAGGAIDWQHGLTHMVGLNEDDVAQFGLRPRPVDFVTGCALLARRAVWEQIGLLDESFFMYYEETEWCVRAARAGWSIQMVPAAMIWHKISVEERASSPRTFYYMTRNRLLFLQRTHASYSGRLRTWGDYMRTFLSWSLWRRQHTPDLRRTLLRAVWDYTRGHFGAHTA